MSSEKEPVLDTYPQYKTDFLHAEKLFFNPLSIFSGVHDYYK